MKTRTMIAVLVATTMLTGAVYAESLGEKTGVNSVLGVAPATQDFVKEAATSDMLEIAAAKIAQQKGNAEEKKFAARMITDHTQTTDDLKAMVTSKQVKATLPTTLDSSAQSKLDDLKSAKPDEFAATYDPMQVSAHKDAVSLFERYAKGGDNKMLQAWANKTLPTLKDHLAMAEKMNEDRRSQTVGNSATHSGGAMAPARTDAK